MIRKCEFVLCFNDDRVGLTLNMYFASLRYTSPTFVASMVNTIASLTFIIAVALRLINIHTSNLLKVHMHSTTVNFNVLYACRLEGLDLGNPRGIAKVLGTLVFLAGAMTMTLYKGPIMHNLWHPLIYIHRKAGNSHESWLKGSILDCCKLHIMVYYACSTLDCTHKFYFSYQDSTCSY